MVASMRHGTHVWLYCGQKGTDPNAISSNLPLTVLCQWNTKTVPWNSNPWNSKVEYDNRGIARVLFHGFGAIPRVLVSSVPQVLRLLNTPEEAQSKRGGLRDSNSEPHD